MGEKMCHQETRIKVPWTKPKWEGLRVGGEGVWGWGMWWQENGDNCI